MSGRDLPIANLPPEHNGVRLLKMIQQRHPGYHPALSLADLAHTAEEDDLAYRCHATLLKYIEPELRSVQVQAEVKETRTIRVSLFEALDGPDTNHDKNRIAEAMAQAPKLPGVIDVEYAMSVDAARESKTD